LLLILVGEAPVEFVVRLHKDALSRRVGLAHFTVDQLARPFGGVDLKRQWLLGLDQIVGLAAFSEARLQVAVRYRQLDAIVDLS